MTAEVGDRAPKFALLDETGAKVSLSDFAGKSLVIYFYPKAFTPGCTTQACDLRDSHDRFIAAGHAVVGVSPDRVEKLSRFREEYELPFSVLSDPDHKVAAAYGVGDEEELREGIRGNHPLDVPDRRQRRDHHSLAQRKGCWPRRPAPARNRLIEPTTHDPRYNRSPSMSKLRFPLASKAKVWYSQLPRPVAIGITALGSTLLAIVLIFSADRLTNGGEVLGSVDINGVDIGGLGERDAVARLQELEIELRTTPVIVSVAGQTFSLDPQEISFDLDEKAMVEAAMRHGRSGTVVGQLGWWVGHFGSDAATVTPVYTYDAESLEELLREWEVEGIAQPAYPGDVRIENGAIVYEYPATGLGIDQESAMVLLESALADPDRHPLVLSTRVIEPPLTPTDIDAAVATTRQLVEADVTLTEPELGFELILPRHLLTQALVITRDESGDIPEFTFDFDATTIQDYVTALGPYLETDAVDAQIVIDDVAETVSILPSVPYREPDRTLLMDEVWAALATDDRHGEPCTPTAARRTSRPQMPKGSASPE